MSLSRQNVTIPDKARALIVGRNSGRGSLYRRGGSYMMTINVAIPPKSADTRQSAGARRRRQQSLALPNREGGTHTLPAPAHVFAKGRDTRHHPDRSLDTSSDKIDLD